MDRFDKFLDWLAKDGFHQLLFFLSSVLLIGFCIATMFIVKHTFENYSAMKYGYEQHYDVNSRSILWIKKDCIDISYLSELQ